MLHAHKAGTQVETTVLDPDGNFKSSLGTEPFYDFNFQTPIYFNENVKIAPGDQINTRCRFNTMDRDKSTLFGLASKDEMCLTYLFYWPKQERLDSCLFANANIMNGIDIQSISRGIETPVFPNMRATLCGGE